jgi:hypothetical protein
LYNQATAGLGKGNSCRNKKIGGDVLGNTNQTQEVSAKRTAKNSVFLDLFQDKKNLLALYRTLHPEDTEATEDSLDIVTIENVLTDNLYNDLGIMVEENRLLILVEAQSTWTKNILVRILLYLAQTYNEYLEETSQSLYKEKKVRIPKPELYVIYTGNRGRKPDIISLSDEFFDGEDSSLEITAKVIYESDTDDIINQYIIFCKAFDDQRKQYGLTARAVKETIRICKDRDVLKEYLESREKEVVTIMGKLFDTEDIMRIYWKDKERTFKEEYAKKYAKEYEKKYAKEYEKKAANETAVRFLKMGKLTTQEIADGTGLTVEEVEKLKSETLQPV